MMLKESLPSTPRKSLPALRSFIHACLIGLLVFGLLFSVLEAAFRLNWLLKLLPMRSVGDYHTQFEQKLFKLDDYVQVNGGVDVILLGNSMINTGIDPAILAERYQELTGQSLRVFNFGIEGLTIAPLSDVAQILTDRYHPGTILLFTEMRDYVKSNGVEVETNFLDNVWIQSQLGKPSLGGTFIEHSLALKHLLSLRNWTRSDFVATYKINLERMANTTAQGYEADLNIGKNITRVPDPENKNDQAAFELLQNFVMDPDRIADLNSILSLQNSGTQILVTEVPVYPTYYAFFGEAGVREQYLTDIAHIVKEGKSVFLPAVDETIIPLYGRADNHHLNYLGAPIYSRYLAEELAAYCLRHNTCLSAAPETRLP